MILRNIIVSVYKGCEEAKYYKLKIKEGDLKNYAGKV